MCDGNLAMANRFTDSKEDEELIDDWDDDTDDEPNFEYFDCVCGAWKWSVNVQRFIHIADCICGSSEPF